jgi:hypothetical protein
METCLSGEEIGQGCDDPFIAVKGGSQTVRGGWSTTVVRIQCFSFSSRGEVTG